MAPSGRLWPIVLPARSPSNGNRPGTFQYKAMKFDLKSRTSQCQQSLPRESSKPTLPRSDFRFGPNRRQRLSLDVGHQGLFRCTSAALDFRWRRKKEKRLLTGSRTAGAFLRTASLLVFCHFSADVGPEFLYYKRNRVVADLRSPHTQRVRQSSICMRVVAIGGNARR